MSKINILPEELSNRIAAGEVVERPASVVKELFENAVDAGADNIVVEIERAGSRLIRVSDNGCGMDENDALLCFSPHATSKINCAEDIDRIVTLGFRGEALPSIASVSRFSLKTRTADTPAGLEIELEGGKVVSQKPAGMPVGTVMTVRDLFYNVPARKKFLKSPATEEAHIQEMVIALALGFPEVSVTLKFDNKIALQCSGSADPGTRAAGLFGKAFAGKMLKLDYTENDIAVKGLIAVPGFTRTSRREQRTFVNGRAVESPALYRGIRDGYGTLADFGRFPPTIINIELDAAEYDINVHPTKREVRFKREYMISWVVTNAVGKALQLAPAPEINLPQDKNLATPEMLLNASNISYQPQPETPAIPGLGQPETRDLFRPAPVPVPDPAPAVPADKEAIADAKTLSPASAPAAAPAVPVFSEPIKSAPQTSGKPMQYPAPVMPLPTPHRSAELQQQLEGQSKFTDVDDAAPLPEIERRPALAVELSDSENLRYAGIMFGTFVMVESGDGETMYLIDFHAAHERVLYEELLQKSQEQNQVPSQQLLLPPAIELSRTAAAFIAKNEKLFAQLGFDAALLSSNTILLNAVPANLPNDAPWDELLTDLVNTALEGEKTTRDSLEAIARAACHAAVKANDPLNELTAKALLKSLARCRRPDVCPHGRPTVLKITKTELSRRFGRS